MFAAKAGRVFSTGSRRSSGIANLPEDLPFHVIFVPPNLGIGTADAGALIQAIQTQLGELPFPVGLIIIDTLRQTLFGAEENGRGMAMFVVNAQAISQAFDATVIALHHSGKDTKKGPSGHYGVQGDPDCRIHVKDDDGKRTVTVEKQRDGSDRLSFTFTLEVKTIGTDKRGFEVTSCVVKIIDKPAAKPGKGANAEPKRSKAHGAFHKALNDALTKHPQVYRISDSDTYVKATLMKHVLVYFKEKYPSGKEDQSSEQRRKAISTAWARFTSDLPNEYGYEAISDNDGRVWKVRDEIEK